MKKTIYALIPARQGSKGILNKNIKPLGGHPLIAYSIALAKLIPEVSRVIVSTDSKEYADIAKKYGAEVPFLRPLEISQDRSVDFDLFKHCINWFSKNEKTKPDFLLHLRPTTPLREPALVSKAIHSYLNSKEATSLRSGHVSAESPFKWFKKNQDGWFTTLADEQDLENVNRARQEFPKVYIPDGYIDMISTDFVVAENKLHGDKVLAFESPYCVEIDTEQEFEYLEYILSKKSSELKQYLDQCKL